MPTCRCGASVNIGETPDGEKIPLEKWTEPEGERRYRVTTFGDPANGTPHSIEPVAADARIDAYPDHRKDCPDHGNGLR